MNSFERRAATRPADMTFAQSAKARGASPHSRFIPREELQGFAVWRPEAFGDTVTRVAVPGAAPTAATAGACPSKPAALPATAPAAAGAIHPDANANANAKLSPNSGPNIGADPAADALPTLQELHADMAAEMARQVAAARTQGYQDGYRDGLVALDSFKQSYANQVGAQVGQVLHALDHELGALEQQMAASVARIATELARQVVRSEITQRPALVAQVAREAVNAVLASARQITVQVHPDDHALVAAGCEDALLARGARLLAQPSVARGGCRVESDAGTVDARVAARWVQATQALGTGVPWDGE